jgi:hypothetical protein
MTYYLINSSISELIILLLKVCLNIKLSNIVSIRRSYDNHYIITSLTPLTPLTSSIMDILNPFLFL